MTVSPKKLIDPRYLIALGFGSGLAPRAPGTAGTLAAVLPFLLLTQLPLAWYAGVVVVAFALGVWVCDWVARDMDVKDPGPIVWDEFVGFWIACFMLPPGWYWVVFGVIAFRAFDILKPWPVSLIDRSVARGLGIMLDDVAAGVYALIMIQTLAWLIAF